MSSGTVGPGRVIAIVEVAPRERDLDHIVDASRDVVAWTRFIAVSTIAALSCIAFNPRDAGVVGVALVLAIYGAAVATFVWAAWETTRAARRLGSDTEEREVATGPPHDA